PVAPDVLGRVLVDGRHHEATAVIRDHLVDRTAGPIGRPKTGKPFVADPEPGPPGEPPGAALGADPVPDPELGRGPPALETVVLAADRDDGGPGCAQLADEED